MIKGAIIHLLGDLPVVADLPIMPRPGDVSVLCTNIRTIDGKRPSWIERDEWLMVVPLATVRLVELPVSAEAASALAHPAANGNGHAGPELETDALASLAVAAAEPQPAIELPAEMPDIEPDEDLLRRIREA